MQSQKIQKGQSLIEAAVCVAVLVPAVIALMHLVYYLEKRNQLERLTREVVTLVAMTGNTREAQKLLATQPIAGFSDKSHVSVSAKLTNDVLSYSKSLAWSDNLELVRNPKSTLNNLYVSISYQTPDGVMSGLLPKKIETAYWSPLLCTKTSNLLTCGYDHTTP